MQLKDTKVLFRAHGEPPEVYDIARRNNITVVDASCGVVLALQQKIRKAHEESPDAQIVILGKKGHAEVIGLEGQIGYSDIVIENESDLNKIDFSRQIILFSQTTKSVEEFNSIVAKIKENLKEGVDFRYYDTICRQVSNRIPELKEFASRYELIIFVSGKNSSNGKVLFDVCRSVNPNTMFVASLNDIDFDNIEHFSSIGICGATSTPIWLMEAVKEKIEHYFTSSDKSLNKKI
jgi:lytB protein